MPLGLRDEDMAIIHCRLFTLDHPNNNTMIISLVYKSVIICFFFFPSFSSLYFIQFSKITADYTYIHPCVFCSLLLYLSFCLPYIPFTLTTCKKSKTPSWDFSIYKVYSASLTRRAWTRPRSSLSTPLARTQVRRQTRKRAT